MILLIWGAVLVAVLALRLHQTYSRFSSHGVKHFPIVPLFGNMLKIVTRRVHIAEEVKIMYRQFRGERFIGRYEFISPTVILLNLDLIKKITIKHFEHFIDHRSFVDEDNDPIFSRNVFSLRGQEWKDMRATLSPSFTSSKIKLMVPFMEEVGDQMLRVLQKEIKESKSGSIEVEVKDLTSRYSNDVIASCAFGLKIDSHTEKENEFYQMGKIATTFKFRQSILFFFGSAFPSLAKKLKMKLISDATNNFFINIVMNTMKDRELRQITRPDMIQILMEVKKGQQSRDEKNGIDSHNDTSFGTVEESSVGKVAIDRVWTDNDLVAQAVVFFIAGFDTISTSMTLTLHELALNPEIQDRLVQEIKDHYAKNGGKLDINSIQNLTYLDMVVSEALRLWPPVLSLDRVCVKDYNMGKPNPKAPKDYIMRKGDVLTIPVWAIHHDPELFPNPDKFDPERFSAENKHKINPMAYMPFGIGPRNCIGSRFGICECKIILYQILLNLEVLPSNKTSIPLKLTSYSFSPRLEGGHWLKFKTRC